MESGHGVDRAGVDGAGCARVNGIADGGLPAEDLGEPTPTMIRSPYRRQW
jgi:hypothetical protein